jgi:single-strand DNA-binding protein
MNQQNLVILEGNACRDAEVKNTNSGSLIGKLSIAVNRYYKSGEGFEKEVSFFDVDCFNEVAKLCGEKVKKGDTIRVTGRLKQNRWQHNGQNRSVVLVVAERVEFGSKAKGGEGQPTEPDAAPVDDDIPF